MSIPSTEYRGYELRAYFEKIFPTCHDPYARGAKEFTSVVMIDTIPPTPGLSRRYVTIFHDRYPGTPEEAIAMAMQFGKGIVDGHVNARSL
ncbi:hypothetical protein E4K72_08170 [Oxalobacteraceae bacterium OM1]|nr:hypothetical protein E4K72_08170 [Oxalobacteraceae bacterium OM1]